MNRKPIIAALLDDKLNGVSLWRTVRPFTDLMNAGAIDFKPMFGKFNEHEAYMADVIYLAHFAGPQIEKVAEAYHLAGKRVWFDLDDDLLNPPVHNFGRAEIVKQEASLKRLLATADIFTVSTQELADKYAEYSKAPPVVLVNSVHMEELNPAWNAGVNALWRSNISQERDMHVRWRDWEVMEKAGIKMAYVGVAPAWVDSPAWTPWGPTLSYFSALRKSGASYFWKPLAENHFNRCKSNITMLEGAMVGALTVCNLRDAKWLPAITAEEVRDRDEAWKRKRYAQMLEWISKNANSQIVGQQRWDVVRGMFE